MTIPTKLLFHNKVMDRTAMRRFISRLINHFGVAYTAHILDQFKTLGFQQATYEAISLSIDDLSTTPSKQWLIQEAEIENYYEEKEFSIGRLNAVEKLRQLIETWYTTSEFLKQEMTPSFRVIDPLNPVHMMCFSGARGSISQVHQMVGMRGLMSNPQGEIIDSPIRSNFREGLSVIEYIISCYGARKGVVDTAVRTADAGYLTRRLVEVVQHIVVRKKDCGTTRGILISSIRDEEEIESFVQLGPGLIGRVLADNLYVGARCIATRNQDIGAELLDQLIAFQIQPIFIRSPLTCKSIFSICQLCFGWNPTHGNLVELGEAVGIIAGQSIGEPGTQLTLRTFHTGGVFTGTIAQNMRTPLTGIIKFDVNSIYPTRTKFGYPAWACNSDLPITISNTNESFDLIIPSQSLILVQNNEYVKSEQVIAEIPTPIVPLTEKIEKFVYSELDGEMHCGATLIRNKSEFKQYLVKSINLSLKTTFIWILSGQYHHFSGIRFLLYHNGDQIDTQFPLGKKIKLLINSSLEEKNQTNYLEKDETNYLENFDTNDVEKNQTYYSEKFYTNDVEKDLIDYSETIYTNHLENNQTNCEVFDSYLEKKYEKTFYHSKFYNSHSIFGNITWNYSAFILHGFVTIERNGRDQISLSLRQETDTYYKQKLNFDFVPERHKNEVLQNNEVLTISNDLEYITRVSGIIKYGTIKVQSIGKINKMRESKETKEVKKRYRVIKGGNFFLIPEEIHTIHKSSSSLLVGNNDIVQAGTQITSNTHSQVSGLIKIRKLTKEQIEIRILPGNIIYLGKNKKISELKNILVPPGRKLFGRFESNGWTYLEWIQPQERRKREEKNEKEKKNERNKRNEKKRKNERNEKIERNGENKRNQRNKKNEMNKMNRRNERNDKMERNGENKKNQRNKKNEMNKMNRRNQKDEKKKINRRNNRLFALVRPAVEYKVPNESELSTTLCYRELLREQKTLKVRIVKYISYEDGEEVRTNSNTSIQLVETCLVLDRGEESSPEEVSTSLIEVKIHRNFKYFLQLNLNKSFLTDEIDDSAENYKYIFSNRMNYTYIFSNNENYLFSQYKGIIHSSNEDEKENTSFLILSANDLNYSFSFNGTEYSNTYFDVIKRNKKIINLDTNIFATNSDNSMNFLKPSGKSNNKSKRYRLEKRITNSVSSIQKTFQNDSKQVTLLKMLGLLGNLHSTTTTTTKNSSFCHWVTFNSILSTQYYSIYNSIETSQVPKWYFLDEKTNIYNLIFCKDISSNLLNRRFLPSFHSCKNPFSLVSLGQSICEGSIVLNERFSQSCQILAIHMEFVVLRLVKPYLVSQGEVIHTNSRDLIPEGTTLLTSYHDKLKYGDITEGLAKIERLLESRLVTPVSIDFRNGYRDWNNDMTWIFGSFWGFSLSARISLEQNQINLVNQIQKIYQSHGVQISDKYLEIIVRQMTSKIITLEDGRASVSPPGELIEISRAQRLNCTLEGEIYYRPVLLGITKASLNTKSFISEASFRETTRVLTRAAIRGRIDWLKGLKENVIIGGMIPAGTGCEEINWQVVSDKRKEEMSLGTLKTKNNELFLNRMKNIFLHQGSNFYFSFTGKTIHKVTEKIADEVTEGTTYGVTEGTADEVTEGTTYGVTEGTADEVTEGIADEVTEGTADEVTEGIADEVTEGTTYGVTEGIADDVTEGTTYGVTEGTADEVTEGTADEVTEGTTYRVTAHEVTEGITYEVTEGTVHEVTKGTTCEVTERTAHETTEKTYEGTTCGVTKGTAHEITQRTTCEIEITEGTTCEITEGTAHEATKRTTCEVTEGTAHEVTKTTTCEVTEETVHEVTTYGVIKGTTTHEIIEGITYEITEQAIHEVLEKSVLDSDTDKQEVFLEEKESNISI